MRPLTAFVELESAIRAARPVFGLISGHFTYEKWFHTNCSRFFEIASALLRLDHVARFIVNANHRVKSQVTG